ASCAPVRILLAGALAHALVNEALLKLFEFQFQMSRRVGAGRALHPEAPVVVHPFEVHGIAGVLLALKPIARHVRERDFAIAVFPGEGLQYRTLGGRGRAQIGPQQAAEFSDRVCLDGALLLSGGARMSMIVIRLFDAAPGFIEAPAVIVATQALLLDVAV